MPLNVETSLASSNTIPHSYTSPITHVAESEKIVVSKDQIEEALGNLDSEDGWENDLENARNWSFRRKWTAIAIVSFYTFMSPLASSMMAPGLPEIASKYEITNATVVALTLSIFLLAYALGPLILAPLSEMYGRTWILHIGNLLTMGFSLGCAFAPTTNALIGFRFLSGLSGGAPVAIGGGSVGDLFAERDRASAMAMYNLGPLIGPAMGPIAGGFIAQTVGVKWVFIVISILCGVAGAISIPLLRETYAPVIRQRRTAKSGGDPEKAAVSNQQPTLLKERGKLYYLWINLSRPITFLFGSLICFLFSLYMALMYGIYYLMVATFAEFFSKTYHFSPGVGGLAYLGLGIGFISAMMFGARFADQIYKYLADKNGGVVKPEMRIPALFVGSLIVPIGLLWYGWSAEAGIHWIMPIIGTGIFGFGMMTTFLPIQLYLVDSFYYAASATSAAALFRSLFGFVFPLFGQPMFDKLGLGAGNSLLAGIAIIIGIPFPIWIYYKGEGLRARNPLTKSSTIPKRMSK